MKPSNRAPSQSARLRADAAKVLFQILEQGQSARDCLPQTQAQYPEKDRAWMQEMIYGVLRNLPLLQSWLRKLLNKPLKKQQKIVEHLILLGLYQIAFSRVSQHAAVSETVAATRPLKCEGLKGLVNAILRNFIRQSLSEQEIEDPQIASGLPKWLFNSLREHHKQNIDSLITQMQTRPPIWLRVNQRKLSTQEYLQHLQENDIEAQLSEHHPDGLVLTKGYDITRLPGFDEGWFAVQDGAAQFAAYYLGAQAGERILDCCAAPGGKTCHILERQPDVQQCVALDIDQARLDRVSENLQRLDLQAQLLVGDASAPNDWWDGLLFDRILLDAPCSATGVIRRHPDIRWLRKAADIKNLVTLQSEILDSIWPLLKSGGTLLYATCSILPDENQRQIEAFLQRTPDATIVPLDETTPTDSIGRQILPGEQQMDGFYYARLLKS